MVALYFPIGFAFGKDIDEAETWEFHPTLLLRFPISRYFEFNPSAKVLIPLHRKNAEYLAAINLGFGVSPNMEKWVLRPEAGWQFNLGEKGYFSQLSIGLTWYPSF